MLKTVSNGAGGVRQAPAASRSLMANTTYQTPANPIPPSRASENTDSTSEKWAAYTNGGAEAEDARAFKMMKDEEARHLETIRNTPPPVPPSSRSATLIKVSPEKKAVSKNLDLLIDLDFGITTHAPRRPLVCEGPSSNATSSRINGRGKATTVNFLG
jgi:helicase required for RNAi-mediated heterochromatin assembly 1